MNRRDFHYGQLAGLLRRAYSGELAAALAYRGHWGAASDPEERYRIRIIEEDEWRHREAVAGMLNQLGERPDATRERRAFHIGLGFWLLARERSRSAVGPGEAARASPCGRESGWRHGISW